MLRTKSTHSCMKHISETYTDFVAHMGMCTNNIIHCMTKQVDFCESGCRLELPVFLKVYKTNSRGMQIYHKTVTYHSKTQNFDTSHSCKLSFIQNLWVFLSFFVTCQ